MYFAIVRLIIRGLSVREPHALMKGRVTRLSEGIETIKRCG